MSVHLTPQWARRRHCHPLGQPLPCFCLRESSPSKQSSPPKLLFYFLPQLSLSETLSVPSSHPCSHSLVLLWCLLFWLSRAAYGILVPQLGIKPGAWAVRALSPNHWATGELPALVSGRTKVQQLPRMALPFQYLAWREDGGWRGSQKGKVREETHAKSITFYSLSQTKGAGNEGQQQGV